MSVVGTVTDMKSYRAVWPGLGTMTFTDVTLTITDVWKGEVDSSHLVLQVPGGKNRDGTVLHVSEAPRFELGEKVLVFVHKKNRRHWVYGWEQGKYRVLAERVVGRRHGPIQGDAITGPLKHKIQTIIKKHRG